MVRGMASINLLVVLIFTSAFVVEAVDFCKSDGFKCRKKCTELVRCASTGNETYAEQVVRKCAGTINKFCDATTLDCSGDSCKDDDINPAVLTCHSNGTFPHPIDCGRFFKCINRNLINMYCPVNTSYSALHGNCSSGLDTRSCKQGPIAPCSSITQIGGYLEDDSIFYMCAYDDNGYLRPEFHKCVDGNVFDSEEGRCVLMSASNALYASSIVLLGLFMSSKTLT